ncbi:DUF397 domain-containing protein [Streptomyces torulosus]|uniref:DUF397 domain-containing protein n=1 Tax=Streptomyces torulosus TaxID=68276 RepID=UPI00099E4569
MPCSLPVEDAWRFLPWGTCQRAGADRRQGGPEAGRTRRKSRYSNTDGGQCLEVADNLCVALVRDSKTPEGPALVVQATAWTTFVTARTP